MYTATLYNFLVMAMAAKITRDLATVTFCSDPFFLVKKSLKVGAQELYLNSLFL
jgi:hypothetical protein